MYILDTNIWLEPLLNQMHAEDVGLLLDTLPVTDIAITEFGWNSIVIILDIPIHEGENYGRAKGFKSKIPSIP